MGQGFSMTTLSAAAVTIDIPELSDLVHDKTLASARFMKSIRARGQNGFVFVKAVQKPYAQFDIRPHVRQATEERNALADVPNAQGYQKIIEIGDTAFLIRQYLFSSVYDRLSTRPFLEDIERKWLAFQLLCAVRDSHARNIFHGDIKSENLLVTSWNWLFLTDYSASFKPTTLPEDNPADFFFYFDTSGRRICYIAPERFTNGATEDAPTDLNWAMDMFSVGCTIAELFLEGPIFTLSQIFKYRTGEYSPEHTHLNKIEDQEIRAMILNMIELDPEKRYSAEQHLSFYKGKIFPDYFYGFLHQYMQDLTEPMADHRPINLDFGTLGESDSKIDKVYQDFDRLSYFLGPARETENGLTPRRLRSASNRSSKQEAIKNTQSSEENENNDGTLLFLTLVSSSLRSTLKASARLKACDLLVAFSNRLPDEAKLDRILPYAVGLLSDRSDVVKVAALNAVTNILDSVEVVSPINAYLFPEYILPKLKLFLPSPQSSPTALVRAAYASCLASLALSSARMLDMVQAIRADGRIPSLSNDEWAPDASFHGLYDVARAELVPHFEEATTALITDPDTSVRRALLGSVSRLCVFFGSTRSSDIILSHLNTYLNDKDWMLRCAFFEALVGIALYVGSSSLEKFILPIMIGSLTDPEGFVVEKVFRSFSRMAALGLLQKPTTWELISIIARYLIHPSIWVREAAVQFIVQSTRYLTASDRYCIILPLLQPFLRAPVLDLTEEKILDHLKSPLPKSVFEAAVLWAARREKSLFWTAAGRDGVFLISDGSAPIASSTLSRRIPTRIPPSQRDKDDQTALETLRNLGMTPDDEIKLLALREYILRVALHKAEEISEKHQMMMNVVPLTQIGVTPQNVFFDQREPVREVRRPQQRNKATGANGQHTLADALLDASTTIDDMKSKRSSDSRPNSVAQTPPRTLAIDLQSNGHNSGGEQGDSQDSPSTRAQGAVGEARRPSSISGRQYSRDLDRLSALRMDTDLRRRGSAINLLSRTDTAKAGAEIATTPETAFGKLDGQINRKSTSDPSTLTLAAEAASKARSRSPFSVSSSITAFEPNHSYTGNDPNVLRLLENHFTENFPIDLLDFGGSRPSADTVTPIKRVSDPMVFGKAEGTQEGSVFHKDPWRPSGQLLTQFAEHTAAINRVVAAPDHAFFVTASDDGTCKVWDTTRLEKNVNPRSKYTHRHLESARVKSLCFVEGTHTFISGADDGSIHAVRIDYRSVDGGENTRYGKPLLVRDYQIPQTDVGSGAANESEYAVWLFHYRTSTSQSVLVAATNHCRVLLIDLKNMEILHVLQNPAEHGAPTTFVVDRRQHWLLVGTTHGILDLWDLRFRLRLRSFGLGGAGDGRRIERLFIHPSKGHGRWAIVSCGGEISVWDIEKLACREVLRPSTFLSSSQINNSKTYEVWSPDDEPPEKLLERFARDVQTHPAMIEPDLRSNHSPTTSARQSSAHNVQQNTTTSTSTSYYAIPALATLTDYLANPAQPSNPNKATILFTAGFDRTIRYWDLSHPDQSFIISGPLVNVVGDEAAKDKIRIRYESSWPTSMSLSGLVQLVEEKVGSRDSSSPSSATGVGGSTPRKTRDRRGQNVGGNGMAAPTTTTTATANATSNTSATSNKATRSSIISAAQQQLLRTHMDGITDLIVLKKPYGCVVSVDRMGNVLVFH